MQKFLLFTALFGIFGGGIASHSAQAMQEAASPADRSKEVTSAYKNYATALHSGNDAEKERTARIAYEKAVEIWGDNSKETGLIALNYANILFELKKTKEALEPYQKCEAILTKFSGVELLSLNTCQLQQGVILIELKNNKEAKKVFKRAVDTGEDFAENDKDFAYNVGTSYQNLATLTLPGESYTAQSKRELELRYRRIRNYAERCIKHLTFAIGADNYQVGLCEGFAGYYYEVDEKWATASDLYENAYNKLLIAFGPDVQVVKNFEGRFRFAKVKSENLSRREIKSGHPKAGNCRIVETLENGDVSLCTVKQKIPKWPISVARAGQQGFVKVQYDVAKDGTTRNISIIDSWPGGKFDKNTIKAVKTWKFEPPETEDGTVVEVIQTTTFFSFTL